ncbi:MULTISPECIES: GntR family transcriptional regulator [unclassified Bradyrhizobium]|uniref:GntR family transcriptional regulator n=1 Tax=unclassified Bradyrhizobium TaxID=2631580 RepID=UPI0024798F1C|nr:MULTISPECIES: GntR family transcriptional regulator [unclassified Bradyrhizobium]WGS23976.1 GntR family transcriptional regulator [Bradyrhizobium sp. ISRA463]WGS31284.1 GntR family transcriptional regulator [Bradyrhizobium sp. ISRA464]
MKRSELRFPRRRGGRPRTETAAARIYTDLRAELVSLLRRPGEPILEGQIALSYGVSRTPVREAILRLSDEGLLEIFPQSGIFVSRIPLAALPEAIIVRRSLEETTARMATERASSSQILALHSILERQREANVAADREAFHQADEAFHAAIADIAGYPGIWRLILQVKVHVDRFRRLTLPQRGRMAEIVAEHEAIMTAIEARDPNAAGTAMVRHIERLLVDISATPHSNPEFFDQQREPI